MSRNNQKQAVSPAQELGLTLDDLVKRGARQVIQQAIEAGLAVDISSLLPSFPFCMMVSGAGFGVAPITVIGAGAACFLRNLPFMELEAL